MPWSSDGTSGYTTPQAAGPVLLATPTLATLPTAAPIAAGGNWTSGVLPGDGFKVISVGLTSTQAGSIVVQRYLDMAGTVTQGAAITVALTAGVAATLNVTDGAPYAAFRLTLSNTGAAAATINPFAILMAAN